MKQKGKLRRHKSVTPKRKIYTVRHFTVVDLASGGVEESIQHQTIETA